MIDQEKYEAVGGLDSSVDEDELDEEMRDKVVGEPRESDSDDSVESDLAKNMDLTHYGKMDIDTKLLTLRNRVKNLANKQREMMEEIKECEVLYGGKDWHHDVDLAYLSDGNTS